MSEAGIGADEPGRGARPAAVRAASIDVAYDARVNFALQQNSVPFVKRVVVTNLGADDLADVTLSITTSPEVAQRTDVRIDRIAAGASHEVSPVDVRLRPESLAAQQEREAGTLTVRATVGDAVVAERAFPFEVLAYDEWNGTASLPEIVAAFVLPNHPEVERILGAARDLLGKQTGNPALEGYQARDPNRALRIVEAVYDAVRALGLTYASPPASFESNGQKVRTPDRIVESRMATCLDLALLFAACLEQAGLHPLVVVSQGHAFVGAWLIDESFPETATTEPYRILKRVQLDAIRVFETTGVASRPQIPFADAVREGLRRLSDVDRFLFSVDVASARRSRIRPIPMRGAPGAVAIVTEIRAVAGGGDAPLRPPSSADSSAPPDAGESARAGRLERWKRKLLDLSLRNRLVNYRDTKQTVPLFFPDLAAIEDALSAGRRLEVAPKPELLQGADPRDAELHRGRTGEDGVLAFVADELKAGRLCARLDAGELGDRLLEMSRGARLSLEEGGANTLYLALGMVAWFESPTSADPRLAPILLVPVEFERRTARDSFRIRLLDDEARLNATLVQKLRTEFGVEIAGLDPLPEDDDGVDVAAVMRVFREAILNLPRWHVRDDATLGLFSFTKFLMWLDLEERHDVLAKNAVVRHLIEGAGEPFDPGGPFPDEATLDDLRDPSTTFCPLDADSSQLAAVFAAADGRTFVLQGPPGTGKSQTIANLVAHSLAAGKRVLFVSEKTAALDVVHRRLERVGLGPFCLPLHSNRAQKKEVLDRLGEALDLGAQATPSDWEARARELQETRAKLNGYCRALHEPRAFGTSAFQAVSRLVGLRDEHEAVLPLGDARRASADLPGKLRAAVAAVAAQARAAGVVVGHPLAPVRLTRWLPQVEDDARRLGGASADAAESLDRAATPVAAAMTLSARPWSEDDLDRMSEWCALLADTPPTSAGELATAPDWMETRALASEAIDAGRDRDARRSRLFARYRPEVLDAPIDSWLATLKDAQDAWAPVRWWKGRGARAAMDLVRATPADASDVERIRDLDEAVALRNKTRELAASSHAGARLFGAAWRGGEADWDATARTVEWTDRFRGVLARTAGPSVDERVRLRTAWLAFVADGRDVYLKDGALAGQFAAFVAARTRRDAARRAFVDAVRLDFDAAFGAADAAGALAREASVARAVASHAGELRAWCGYQLAREEAGALALTPLVDDLESGAVAVERLGASFERSFLAWWVNCAFAESALLAEFSSTLHGLTIERFRELEAEVLAATVGVLRARLAAALPRNDPSVSSKSKGEMGTLKREREKKARHMPLRRLFGEIPNALARLKPCMLMSPLSVAQYLAPDFPRFDLVVFDEASQIPVWDAIGAVARGERLVVVGDSKQLPPTTFFEKEDAEEDLDEDDVEDLESILNECVAAGLPQRTLDWHYRSRHESLIAFSNRKYYGGRLLTFPSAEAAVDRMGVSLRPVPDGVYDKGHSRSNRREAEELVADLVRRLLDPAESRRSVGVVTFSMAQQTLVENLLEEERRRRPEIEPFFAADRHEPVFVKNLENVQGDERDVILFSVCYGPDAQRRVYMNFGPLNRTGGERRLNVAITRAREQVVVFSTLRADQIDLARTRAVGVRDLKAFLEYAERGPGALGDAESRPTGADSESPFEEDVEKALIDRGWTVHRQVGCSGYRVDLAVVEPDRPGRYVLGIECDGATYHSGRTARDRDRLREAVLRSLGWRLHRVWSTDWWYEPAREIAKIEASIADARRAATAVGDAATTAQVSAPASPSFASPAAPTPVADARSSPTYPAPLVGPLRGRPELFFERPFDMQVAITLREVVEVEAPILVDLAVRRVAALWGAPRVTARTADRVTGLIGWSGVRPAQVHGEALLWRADQDPGEFAVFRRPRQAGAPERVAEHVPFVELVQAVRYVLEAQLSAPVEDVARETARLFGIARLGSDVRARMERAIEIAEAQGVCRREDGTVTLLG